MPSSFIDDLRLAHLLADDADSLTMSRFRSADLHVVTKADSTPVTDADHAVEEVVRRTLGRARPRDAVVGEEQGSTGWGPRRWIVDPIDGTKSFMRGVPVWATLIALMVEDSVVVGCVSAPALGRRWWASLADGASTGKSLTSARPCRVSDVSRLDAASVSYSSFVSWEASGRLEDALALSRRCWQTRAYGDFWSHLLVAEGAVDIAAEPELKLHDMAALSIVVEEAGGRFTDLAGRPGPLGAGAVSSNGRLHDEALAFLGERTPEPGSAGSDPGRVSRLSTHRQRRDTDDGD
ncbi:MAG TPA: inositol monophosphatase family protein [Nocardioidaceae bacterium]|jgi:histidinol-phosphatase|nr:inositol monophosphatase family protein [Nocardioidaceae bacterium]